MPSVNHKSINLLIIHDQDSPKLKKIKKIVPIIAVVQLIIFIIIFIISFTYTNFHVNQFNELKKQVQQVETQISDKKNIEQTYTLSNKRLTTISQVLTGYKDISPIFEEINSLQNENILITTSSVDENGKVAISFVANTYKDMEIFIDSIIEKEEVSALYSNIRSQGVVRDKKGKYSSSLSFVSKIPNI
jgi:hypothetical protein